MDSDATWKHIDAEEIAEPMLVNQTWVMNAIPEDYLTYLLGQKKDGGVFTDRVERTIGGRPATLVTATTKTSLNGSLGCFESEQLAHDCTGLQPELTLRIAVIPDREQTLLIWLREDVTVDPDNLKDHLERFYAMLDSLAFDPEPTNEGSEAAGAETAIDGTWAMSSTRAELASADVYDTGEINDGNWGTFTLDLRNGTGVETMENDAQSYRFDIAYHLDGDVLTVQRSNGEKFVMRWKLTGGQLVLTRDDALGVAPITFVQKPLAAADR